MTRPRSQAGHPRGAPGRLRDACAARGERGGAMPRGRPPGTGLPGRAGTAASSTPGPAAWGGKHPALALGGRLPRLSCAWPDHARVRNERLPLREPSIAVTRANLLSAETRRGRLPAEPRFQARASRAPAPACQGKIKRPGPKNAAYPPAGVRRRATHLWLFIRDRLTISIKKNII